MRLPISHRLPSPLPWRARAPVPRTWLPTDLHPLTCHPKTCLTLPWKGGGGGCLRHWGGFHSGVCLSGHLQGEVTRGATVHNSYRGLWFGRGEVGWVGLTVDRWGGWWKQLGGTTVLVVAQLRQWPKTNKLLSHWAFGLTSWSEATIGGMLSFPRI